MNKILIASVLAFFVGFLSNQLLSTTKSTVPITDEPDVATCSKLADAKSSLISISRSDYLEYTKIKDLKQKYEKADELLGKIMLLFLADVGFKTQKVSSDALTKNQPAQVEAGENSEAGGKASARSERSAVDQRAAVAPALTVTSASIQSLQTEKQIRDALDNVVIANPKIEVAQGGMIHPKQVRLLEGRYRGAVNFLDEKRGPLTVVWELLPDRTKKGLSGTFNLSIHGPGKDSESSGHGDIDNIVSLSKDPGGFIVSACGDQCYLQLYYNSPSDRFIGNYYETDKGAKVTYQRVGVIELRR